MIIMDDEITKDLMIIMYKVITKDPYDKNER